MRWCCGDTCGYGECSNAKRYKTSNRTTKKVSFSTSRNLLKIIEMFFSYKHAIDGLWRVYSEEGFRRLFSGCSTATSRAVFMTIGQLSFYDQVKKMMLESGYFKDNLTTHFTASSIAGAIATSLTQPLDVLKTRAMNAKPGEFTGVWDIVRHTAKLGPLGFFKGYVPAFVRLAPQTILTFVFLEQLRLNFGVLPNSK